MKTVTIAWQPDAARFEARGGHEGQTLAINAPHESGPVTGFSATELLLAGAGACSAWDVVEILRKQQQHISAVEVEVRGEQDEQPPWPYRRLQLRFTVRGTGLRLAAVQRAVELSVERYCSVLATVRGVAAIETEVEVTDDEGTNIQAGTPARTGG